MANSLWLVDNPGRTLLQGDRLAGPRSESYRWELLDLTGAPMGDLDGVTDGGVEWSNATTLRASGSLVYDGADEIDWLHSLVRAWYHADFPDGTNAEWPLGTFIPAAPSTAYDDGRASRDVALQSLLQVLDEDVIDTTYGLAAGTVVTAAVRALIAGAGSIVAGRVAGTDSTETLRSPRVWEPGTSRLRIINDLLDTINYFALSVDGMGTYRLDPYIVPSGRAVAWSFADDDECIYHPAFTHESDLYAAPNRVLAIAQGDGDAPSLTATSSNMDPADPLSIPSRGRTVTHVEDNVEATSQSVLQGIADRRRLELAQVSSVVEISHLPIDLTPNDFVTFKDGAGIDLRGVVQKWSLPCAPGALMKTTIREVVS